MESQMKHRILVIAHGHPDFSLGGAEIAAYHLFKAYKAQEEVEETWFLARADSGRGSTGKIRKRRDNEYLWEQAVDDAYMNKTANLWCLTNGFVDLIKALKPTIVHMHHYAHMGLEFIRVIKQVDPSIRIFFTLHEYMAICRSDGQMVKRGEDHKLCSNESFDECVRCFPDKTAEDFWLRKHYHLGHFKLIDGFISPSEFLRQRYIQWGIDKDKIIMIENGQLDRDPLPDRQLAEGETRNRFAYFGQINPYKGIDLLLEAVLSLKKEQRKKIVVEMNGANLGHQAGKFQKKITRLSKPLIKEGVLRWMGAYEPGQQMSRMQNIDWVIVPSIWWENSPMVIQEAFVAGRPLIVSDIGGMAEKVTDGVDGVHFGARNPLHLSQKLLELSSDNTIWEKMRAGIKKPRSYAQCAKKHFDFFEN